MRLYRAVDRALTSFDHIIVGAGSAGAVLAARLSEDRCRRVLLIEAGARDWSPAIHVPGLLGNVLTSARLNWNYGGDPDPGLGGRAMTWMGGKVLGGSSSINGMVCGRGLPHDYARWVEAGNTDWSWDAMVPWFRKLEHWCGPPGPTRGYDGPLHTRLFDEPHPACTSAMAALVAAGVPFVDDYNAGISEGIGYTQATQRGGWRHSAARAYLGPAARRPNLTVATGAFALTLEIAGGRCTGVRYLAGNRERVARADREVTLAMGAIGSPAMLLRSGVGDGEALKRVGINAVHALPGVGRNLNEHVQVKVSAAVSGPTYNSERTGVRKWRNALRWAVDRRGPAASPANHCQGFIKTDPSLAAADVQVQLMAFAFHDDPAVDDDGVTAVVSPCAPRARGTVSLRSSDPTDRPRIAMELLSDPHDVATLIRGCRIARAALEAGPVRDFAGRLTLPSPATDSNDEWLAMIRRTAAINWHPTSTCRMGDGVDDVVAGDLAVRGMTGLSICDASVFPNVTSSNTNVPVIAVAERGAAIIATRTG